MTPGQRIAVKYIRSGSNLVHLTPEELAEYIDAAIAAEREACAKIAELDSVLNWSGGSTGSAKGTANRIAAAIRART